MPDQPDPPPKSRAPGTLRIIDLVRPHWKTLTIALVAVLGETLTDILEPWPIKIVVDNILQSKKLPPALGEIVTRLFGQNANAIVNFAVAAVAVIAIVGAVSSYVEKYLTTSVSQWVAHDLRRTLYQHIQRLSLAEHDKARTGDLITRVTSDIGAVQDFINSALLGMLVDVMTLVGMIGVMFYLNWRFTLIALSVAPVLFLVVYSYTRRIKSASRAVRKQEGILLSIVEEVLTSIRVVKAFAREDYEQQRFDTESLANVEAGLQARSIKAKLSPLVEVIVAFGTCLVLWYGARLALAGQLTAGVLIVFLLYLGKMYKPMRDLSKMTDTVSKAMVGYERIQEVLDIESRVRDVRGARPAPRFKGRIEFNHVGFSYDGGKQALKDVSFTIEAGQVAAIVGPSGTGKTTLVSLIPRFYDPVVRVRRHRRHGHSSVPVEVPARSDQLRPAGHAALPRDRLGEHRLRQAQRHARRDQARRRTGRCARLHRGDARGLRHHGRRARHVALGRSAPAHRHCPGDHSRHADPDSRRADRGTGRRVRASRDRRP